jgi:hypothetical protein
MVVIAGSRTNALAKTNWLCSGRLAAFINWRNVMNGRRSPLAGAGEKGSMPLRKPSLPKNPDPTLSVGEQ